MERDFLSPIAKLAMFGQMAGFSLDQMIALLDAGLSVEGLLDLIELKLTSRNTSPATPPTTRSWATN